MQGGILITFEGLEGAGKSTQARLLLSALNEGGYPCYLTSEPGGTPVGDAVRSIIADNRYRDMTALSELYLFSASRAQLVEKILRPSLEEGKIVICDRYFDTTMAYQGFGRGLPMSLVAETISRASWDVRPDITFYLDIEPSKGLNRIYRRIQELEVPADRIEKESLEFFEKVREGYYYISKEEPARFRILNADMPPEELHRAIFEQVDKELKKRKFKKGLMYNP